MLLGLGLDVVDTARFAELLAEPGTAFGARVFTPQERLTAAARPSGTPAVHLAARYAAKEATIKALSQALAPAPLPPGLGGPDDLVAIEVLNDAAGRPSLALSGRMRALAERVGVTHLHVSLSHDGGIAQAIVLAYHAP